MKWKSTLLLFVIFNFMFGYVFFYERHITSTNQKNEISKRVFSFNAERVKHLTIKNGNGIFEFERATADDWMIVKPLMFKADAEMVKSILSELRYLEFDRDIQKDRVNLRDIGLDNPQIEAKVLWGKKEHTISLGGNTAVGEEIYIVYKTDLEEKVYVVDKKITETLSGKLNDFRNKDVVGELMFIPDSMEVISDGSIIKPELDNDHIWQLVEPIKRRADDKQIADIINAVESLTIMEYIDDSASPELPKYGIDAPKLKLEFKRGSQKLTIKIGTRYKDNLYYIQTSLLPNIFAIDIDQAKIFFSSLFDLSAKHIFFMDDEDIASIEIGYMPTISSLIRKNGKWEIIKPYKIPADSSEISKFLTEFRSYEIIEYITDKALIDKLLSNSANSILNVNIFPVNKKLSESGFVFYFNPEVNKLYVKQKDDNTLLLNIKSDTAKLLPFDLFRFADKSLFEINRYTMERLIIEQDNNSLELKRDNDKWLINGELLLDNDSEDILNTIEQIKVQRVIGIADDNALTKYKLVPNGIKVTILFSNIEPQSEKKVELILGELENNEIYSYKKGSQLIFTLDNNLMSKLSEKLFSFIKNH